ncbi:TPA: DpnD/PcfM family protein [Enterococcus faecalis]|uniref:DpnD/PcfM family protein n=1 Tax=Enterococcus faecalis TaxID=1351 RepID=UPI0022216BA3|nr:DpnD/PcfM family protein [Enterococcus faecalis]UYY26343.1 DpnD/PcfM family protein [Enterococcus faecalis]UYY42947.1 DpnD/PcfM family protein [Enterococcus faecalis]HCR3187535.1 DpnD/PcfM family protein [Enterococcus faecalis]HCR3673223.1 DpnD/PcfM family protein [Enterococcus faecalis]
MKYPVEITEILQGIELDVIAESKEEAIQLVKEKYFDHQIVLDSEDYVETRFEILD